MQKYGKMHVYSISRHFPDVQFLKALKNLQIHLIITGIIDILTSLE